MTKRRIENTQRTAVRQQGFFLHDSQEPLSASPVDPEEHSSNGRAWLDFVIASVLFTISSPLLLVVALLPKFADGGPVLWRGERLGKGRKPFVMYKIRSLALGSEDLIGGKPLTPSFAVELALEHRYGRFLRESHLDELPQFINVLKGDMHLIGPRPIRREVYEAQCRGIAGYDRRFIVKPGIFGYSQVLTPHDSDKRIRKKLDNHFIAAEPRHLRKLLFLTNVLIALIVRLPRELINALRQSRKNEVRKLHRVAQSSCRIDFVDDPSGHGVVTDVSDSAMTVQMNKAIVGSEALLRLEVRVFQWRCLKYKRKIAYCRVLEVEQRPARGGAYPIAYALRYQPFSPHNHYLIQKYLLRRSLL